MDSSKRKTVSPVMSDAKKKKLEKRRVLPQQIELPSEMSASSYVKEFCSKFKEPEDAIRWLLANAKMTIDEFFSNKWEKESLAMHAAEEDKQLKEIFSCGYFEKVVSASLKQKPPRKWMNGCDIYVEKYADGKSSDLDIEVTEKELKQALTEKFSIQVCEPQRYQRALHAFMERLETYFGSLSSSNGFISPAGCQFRGPRYDNENYFVLQTEGSQIWKLYKPVVELSVEFSDDLDPAKLDKPTSVVTLKPGDVLYIPRGTIFESVAGDDALSAYVILSVYQNHHIGRYLAETIPVLLDEYVKKNVGLREGLPLGFLPHTFTMTAEKYANSLLKLADCIRDAKNANSLPVPVDMLNEFMSNRLPPFTGAEQSESDRKLTKDAKVRLTNKAHVSYYTRPMLDSDLDEHHADEEAEEVESADDEKRNKASGDNGTPGKATPKKDASSKATPKKDASSKATPKKDTPKKDSAMKGAATKNTPSKGSTDKAVPDKADVDLEEKELVVLCSVYNDVATHRMTQFVPIDSEDNTLCFSTSYTVVLEKLFKAEDAVTVSQLETELGDKSLDLTVFLQALMNIGALEVVA